MRSAAHQISSWAAIVHQQKEIEHDGTQSLTPKEFLLRHESGIYSTARTIQHKVYDLENHLVRLVDGTLKSENEKGFDPEEHKKISQCVESVFRRNLRVAMKLFCEQFTEGQEARLYLLMERPSPSLLEASEDSINQSSYVFVQELPVVTKKMVPVQVRRYQREAPDVKSLDWLRAKKDMESELPPDMEECLLAGGADHNELYEGLSSNFFTVQNGTVYVAPEGTILLGTVMRLVMDACKALDIPLKREVPRLEQVSEWEGCFITSTSRLVLPISSVQFPDHPDIPEKTFEAPCDTILSIQQYVQQELETRSVDVIN